MVSEYLVNKTNMLSALLHCVMRTKEATVIWRSAEKEVVSCGGQRESLRRADIQLTHEG